MFVIMFVKKQRNRDQDKGKAGERDIRNRRIEREERNERECVGMLS